MGGGADSVEVLKEEGGRLDFLFIDADKEKYRV